MICVPEAALEVIAVRGIMVRDPESADPRAEVAEVIKVEGITEVFEVFEVGTTELVLALRQGPVAPGAGGIVPAAGVAGVMIAVIIGIV